MTRRRRIGSGRHVREKALHLEHPDVAQALIEMGDLYYY